MWWLSLTYTEDKFLSLFEISFTKFYLEIFYWVVINIIIYIVINIIVSIIECSTIKLALAFRCNVLFKNVGTVETLHLKRNIHFVTFKFRQWFVKFDVRNIKIRYK